MRTSLWGAVGALLIGTSVIAAAGVSARVSPGRAKAAQPSNSLKALRNIRPQYFNTVSEPAGLVANPSTLVSDQGSLCTLTLDLASQSDQTFIVSTDLPAAFASIPASVTVPAGQTSASFNVQAAELSMNVNPTITASLNNTSASVTVTVQAAAY
ncbi:MAG TPA: hypothetical protein VFJ58_27085 [Armatimonadota bacterium]|nr:hypothetical protein [Armatimonadota bacterium]